MTDAFADVIDDSQSSVSNGGNDDSKLDTTGTPTSTATDTDVTATDFADAVRTTVPDPDETLDTKRYEDPDSDDAADDVDARGLFRTPTLNELRYYAREGPYGETIVEKPIDDAFKHGFEIVGDNTERETTGIGRIKRYLNEYKPYYKLAEKKSRRDGLCVVMHQIADAADSVAEPISDDGGSHQGFQLWTVDNLSDELADSTVAEHTDYDVDQIYVSEGSENGGIAVVDDISSPDHGDVLGYGIQPRQESTDVQLVQFVHEDRCERFVWGEHVDGNLGNNLTGKHVGESVLTSVLQPLVATQMGYWAMKNILFRYSAPLHAVEPPESWGIEEWNEAENNLDDISMASDALLPPGSELSVAEAVSEFDPEPIYDVLVESICGGTIFTKSVLQGTQTGTVSGSETDLKGYFNSVHLLRTERIEEKFEHSLRMVSDYDPEKVPPVAINGDWKIDWGPMFKPSAIEQAEGAVSLITAVSNGIKNYVLTPDEARSLVEEEWATFDIEVSLDELTEEQMDDLDRINMNEAGKGASDNEPDTTVRQNPRVGNGGGGQPEGQTRESSQPTRDSLSDEELALLADAVAERLDE